MASSATDTASETTGRAGAQRRLYRQRVERLRAQYAAVSPEVPIRLGKKTSNFFRPRPRAGYARLDVAEFDGVIDVDVASRRVDVQAMTSYEHLVDVLLPLGMMPLVVPELKTITVGGAVTGLGIESSSWRYGMPHESLIELDVMTGDGEVVTARADNEHADLFYGFPNSYGTLGYALRLELELEHTHPYLHLRHLGFRRPEVLVRAIGEVCAAGEHGGERVDFVDGVVFSPTESYLTLASWCDDAPYTSDYTRQAIYYRSIPARDEDFLTVRDYLWRWDTDWFWCSRAFLAQHRLVRRLAGPRFLRSDVYWRIKAYEDRYRVKARVDSLLGRPEREDVIQDVELPLARLEEFLDAFRRTVPISPIWLCPLRQRDPAARWHLYGLDAATLYVNVGFWSSVPVAEGMPPDHYNRWVESEVDRLGGRKSLYSTAFYDEARFWELYNGPVYRRLKERYDPSGRLLDLYAKCVGGG
jgi:FAD/FMN-containing dehydrogenase